MKRRGRKDRSSVRPYLMMPRDMLDSPQFAALSAMAVKLLLEVGRKYNGKNNGALTIERGELVERGFSGHRAVDKARDELERAGFLQRARHGHRNLNHLYAIAWRPVDECADMGLQVRASHAPADTWRSIPAQPRQRRRQEPRGARYRRRRE